MNDYRSEDWINGEQDLGGEIALVRKNVSLASVRRQDYPHELCVHLVYEELQERKALREAEEASQRMEAEAKAE